MKNSQPQESAVKVALVIIDMMNDLEFEGGEGWCRVYLPNYREFYESRQFNPAQNATVRELELCGQGNMRSARM